MRGERVRPQREHGHRGLGAQLQLGGVGGVVRTDREHLGGPQHGGGVAQVGDRREFGAARAEIHVDDLTDGVESVGTALDELLQVARRLGHHLVEEECGLAVHHRESRGRLAFGSEVRELHWSRLSGASARPVWEVHNEPGRMRGDVDNRRPVGGAAAIHSRPLPGRCQAGAPAARQRCIDA